MGDGAPSEPTTADRSGLGLMERLWAGERTLGLRLLSGALAPVELAFRAVIALRDAAYRTGLLRSTALRVPTVSVGNLTVGGTGKTPMVRWLVGILVEQGRTPGVLHGGYADDEPALHRRWYPELPVVADRDRVRGARVAVGDGADVVVLDDGFQHRRLARDLDVVLVTAESWTESPRLLPRGPFREPLRALERADVVVITRRTAASDRAAAVAERVRQRTAGPVVVAHLEAGGWLSAPGKPREGSPRGEVVAVAGVGEPDAFFRQLSAAGVTVAHALSFRDHHVYTAEDADRIREASQGRPVVTTAKDAIKLAGVLADIDLWVLDQTVAIEGGREALMERLEDTVE